MSALPGAAVVHPWDSGLHREGEGEGGGDDDKCSEEERLKSHERFGMRDDWLCTLCAVWSEREGWVEYLWREVRRGEERRGEEMLRGPISEF